MSWSAGPEIEARLVTEDGSEHAHDTVFHLLRRMLQIIEPALATQRLRALRLEGSDERQAAQPHRWASKNDKDRLLVKKLARSMATDLAASRFVILHADADVCWVERPSKYKRSFEDDLLWMVRAALASDHLSPRRPGAPPRPTAMRPAEEVNRLIARVVLLMPYYTMESWLYQNTGVAIRICREKYQAQDVQRLGEWEADRTRLDDTDVQELRTVCLQKNHNLELASASYPAAEVYAAKMSFQAAVEALRACADLRAALGGPAIYQ